MPQNKILIDTNTYIRLAQSIRPLLFEIFGKCSNCLYVLPELNDELSYKKLNSKFPWINEAEYQENRIHFPNISRKQIKSIQQTFDYLWNYVKSDFPGPSKVDTKYIAYALELDIFIVTDDQDMRELAILYEAKVMTTLELLKLMLDSNHIEFKKIQSLHDYWISIKDMPANLKADFKKLFLSN